MKLPWLLTLHVLCCPAIKVRGQQKAPRPRAPRREFKIPAKISLEADIEDGRAGGRSLKLDVLRPKAPGDNLLPVVVALHGGG